MPRVTAQYRAERRAHIMAAARRCFVRDGFHASSMQDLVEEAGVSSGAVYRYFTGKDAVIEAIAAENLDQVVTVLTKAIDEGASAAAAIAAVLEFVTIRHGEDGFAAIALLVWSEALRNSTLAGHLRDAIAAASATLNANPHPAAGSSALTELLLCILPGYLMRLALNGPEFVGDIPGTVEKLLTVSASASAAT